MKKIIAFLSVLAMVVSMTATVSFAAGNTVVFTEKNKTANSVELEISLDTEYSDIQTIALYLNVADAVDKGATVTGTAGEATTFKYQAAKKMFICNYIKTDGVTKYTNKSVLGTIKFDGITSNFDIEKMVGVSGAVTKISSTADGEITSKFGTIGTSVTMVTVPTKVDPTANVETKTVGTTQGFLASCEVSDATYAINGLTLNFVAGEATAEKAFTFTTIEAGTAMYAVNVTGVEDGVTVTATATPSIVK